MIICFAGTSSPAYNGDVLAELVPIQRLVSQWIRPCHVMSSGPQLVLLRQRLPQQIPSELVHKARMDRSWSDLRTIRLHPTPC